MNLLLTGSNGLLGSALAIEMSNRKIRFSKFIRNGDLLNDFNALKKFISIYDCVIHTAANTDVENCELNDVQCYIDNTFFTERLAAAASFTDTKFVFISSTGVYGNKKVDYLYNEYDKPFPTTVHHISKLVAEDLIWNYTKNSLIIRTGWLFGGNPENPKNFVARRVIEALNSKTGIIYSNAEQKGCPSFVNDVAAHIIELIIRDEVGTFNAVNKGTASRYEYVSEIIKCANLNVRVEPVSSNSFQRKAMVSENETALNLKLITLGIDKFPEWRESLREYVNLNLQLIMFRNK